MANIGVEKLASVCVAANIERVEAYRDEDGNLDGHCWYHDGPKNESDFLPGELSGQDIEDTLIAAGILPEPLKPVWGVQYIINTGEWHYSYTGT